MEDDKIQTLLNLTSAVAESEKDDLRVLEADREKKKTVSNRFEHFQYASIVSELKSATRCSDRVADLVWGHGREVNHQGDQRLCAGPPAFL